MLHTLQYIVEGKLLQFKNKQSEDYKKKVIDEMEDFVDKYRIFIYKVSMLKERRTGVKRNFLIIISFILSFVYF